LAVTAEIGYDHFRHDSVAEESVASLQSLLFYYFVVKNDYDWKGRGLTAACARDAKALKKWIYCMGVRSYRPASLIHTRCSDAICRLINDLAS